MGLHHSPLLHTMRVLTFFLFVKESPTSYQVCFLADRFPMPGIPFPYSISCLVYLSGLRFIVSSPKKPFQTLPILIMFTLLFFESPYKSHFLLYVCLGLLRNGFPTLACEIETDSAHHCLPAHSPGQHTSQHASAILSLDLLLTASP